MGRRTWKNKVYLLMGVVGGRETGRGFVYETENH